MENNELYICDHCDNSVDEEDEFCPHCGSLFSDDIYCINHTNVEADGVCVICCEPFCYQCSEWVNNILLCKNHASYEIYEGMARVYGTTDDSLAQHVQQCLEQADLHPVIFSRMKSHSRAASGLSTIHHTSHGHKLNEIKIMIPFQEVQKAEEIIKDLKL